MGAVQVGDVLVDEHGLHCQITATSEVMNDRPCFEVLFSDGTSIIADAQHQWVTMTKDGVAGVRTTAEIAATLLDGNGDVNHSMPFEPPPGFVSPR